MKLTLPHIAFEITGTCNLNCRYCYNIWKVPEAEACKPGSYKKALRTLKQLFKTTDVQHLTFTGGEPFLSERFPEVVLFARMKGKSITLITNGTSASKEEYQHMLNLGVSLFEIPVHSASPEIHDRMTQHEGSWQKAQNSINYLLGSNAYVVPVIVLTRFNTDVLEETLHFLKKQNLTRIMMNRYNYGGYGIVNPEEISATLLQLKKAYHIANHLSKELGLKITSNVCTPRCVINPKNYPMIGFGNCSPDVLRRPITLDIEGNIRLCNHSPVVAGNIFQQKPEEILFSDYAQQWAEIKPQFCSNCELWERCMGGCRAASEQMGLPLSEPDPMVKMLG
jgi:radical SAM protein with 4Fe4S-binding SPASM domain